MMNVKKKVCLLVALLFIPWTVNANSQTVAEAPTAVSLRSAVPIEAHLAIYAQRNPERAYQAKHFENVWETVQKEGLVERFMDIISAKAPEEELEQARSVMDQLQSCFADVRREAWLEAEEFAHAQVMQMPANYQLFLIRTNSQDAIDLEQAFVKLFDLVETWTDGKIAKLEEQKGTVTLTLLDLPKEVPIRPAFARVDDIVIISTGDTLVRDCVDRLQSEPQESKFDDPRLIEALYHLPEPEDVIVFFDATMLFDKVNGWTDFVKEQNPDKAEKVDKIRRIMDRVVNEMAIVDYEVTVEYTEGQQNRTAAFTKLASDAEDKMLYQAMKHGQPFEDWHSWVPANAEAFSLNTGVNCHYIYEWVVQFLRDEIPESQEILDQFEEKQAEIGIHLDRDILQSFSGESVSITLPIEAADGSTTQQGVTALRCSNPERIRELIQMGMDWLAENPSTQGQQLSLVDSEELEGFQELHAPMLAMFQATPVIGFYEDWMILSGSSEAVGQVLEVKQGNADSIKGAPALSQFDLETAGPVSSVSYTDIGAAVEQSAKTIEKIGAIAPMFMGMAAAQTEGADLQQVQEMLGLLPSVAKVVRSFDFLEDKLVVTREGPIEGSFRKDSVMLIKAPSEN